MRELSPRRIGLSSRGTVPGNLERLFELTREIGYSFPGGLSILQHPGGNQPQVATADYEAGQH